MTAPAAQMPLNCAAGPKQNGESGRLECIENIEADGTAPAMKMHQCEDDVQNCRLC